eukprot:PhF_6_TR43490/c0_g1_i1/m.66755
MNIDNDSSLKAQVEAAADDITVLKYKMLQENVTKSYENFEKVAKGGFPVEATPCSSQLEALTQCYNRVEGLGPQGVMQCSALVDEYHKCGEVARLQFVAQIERLQQSKQFS